MAEVEQTLSHKDFSRKGGEATNARYPKEIRSQWAKKGSDVVKAKYGPEFYRQIGLKGVEARKKKKI